MLIFNHNLCNLKEFYLYYFIILNYLIFLGSFFLPKDQQVMRPPGPLKTNYEGLAYLGEYPLSWAACLGNETLYNRLVDWGVSPDLQDSFGNMVLHMVVVCNQLVSIKVLYWFMYIEEIIYTKKLIFL